MSTGPEPLKPVVDRLHQATHPPLELVSQPLDLHKCPTPETEPVQVVTLNSR